MINLSLNELKLIAKSRSVKDYKNKSEEDLKKYSANHNQTQVFLKRKSKRSKKILAN